MTVYLYSTIANGQEIDFDPATDVLSFDDGGVSAADFVLGMNAEGDAVTFEGESKSFSLAGTTLSVLDEANVTFADGSVHRQGWDGDVPADACVRVGAITATVPAAAGPVSIELHATDGTREVTNQYVAQVLV